MIFPEARIALDQVTDRRAEFEATLGRTARQRADEAGAALERASLFRDALYRFAGRIDNAMMRFLDALYGLPHLR